MLAAIALVIFVLAAFGVKVESFNLAYMGLAFLAAALLFGNWPIGLWTRRE